jgi:Stealth protein CR2, conserved region 2/Stealth protein CR3, conserved region 3/Stealth protein CR1, conserved region 1/Stealth protein CR4, conserved region 4
VRLKLWIAAALNMRNLWYRTDDSVQPDHVHCESSLPVVPLQQRAALLKLIESKLASRGIDFRSQFAGSSTYCALLASDIAGVYEVLTQLSVALKPERLLVRRGNGLRYDDVFPVEDLTPAHLAEAESALISVCGRAQCHPVSRSGAVELLFLELSGTRYLSRRKRAAKVDWTAEFVSDGPIVKESTRRKGKTPKVHYLEDEPIDVVYTWVDSTDPDWRASMREWANREEVCLGSSNNEERYLDREELRYSLRSLWLFAPYVRNIYLITAGHSPRWLDRSYGNIHVIPHEAIFPEADSLPTFNSHAIEACLHRIPDLAEHFIYFNDDVLLGQETTIETFFTKSGLIKSRFSETASIPAVKPDLSATPTDWASYNAASIVRRDFGLLFERKLKHVPMALTRSLLYEIDERYIDLIARTRRSRFRAQSDLALPTMLAHFYGICTRKVVEWEHVPNEYLYADTGRSDFEWKLGEITNTSPTFICLNATRHSDIPLERQQLLLREFLSRMYPWPSPFETLIEGSELPDEH